MATKLHLFVLVRVTMNAPLVRASRIQITRIGTSTGTGVTVHTALFSQVLGASAVFYAWRHLNHCNQFLLTFYHTILCISALIHHLYRAYIT